MSTVTKSALPSGALTAYNALFLDQLLATPSNWEDLCQVLPSDTDTESYNWLGFLAGMREWVGERQAQGLNSYSFTIQNKKYEETVEVPREVIEDDKLGLYAGAIRQLGANAAIAPWEQIIALLNAGFTTTCYDGQYFFDTDHSEGDSGSQSNKGTTALSRASLSDALAVGPTLVGDRGKKLRVEYTHLVVGPELKLTALELLNSLQLIGTPASNALAGSFNALSAMGLKLVVDPLVNTNNWYLLDMSKKAYLAPMIWQWRVRPELEEDRTDWFKKDKVYYGSRGRWNCGYALWQLAYGAAV